MVELNYLIAGTGNQGKKWNEMQQNRKKKTKKASSRMVTETHEGSLMSPCLMIHFTFFFFIK